MTIVQAYSHMGGLEFLKIHQPAVWTDINSAIASADDRDLRFQKGASEDHKGRVYSAARFDERFINALTINGWKSQPGGGALAKSRVAVEINFGLHSPGNRLFAAHLASYIDDLIDVGVVILPTRDLYERMSSGTTYYERELHNLIREGRGLRTVPLILIGVSDSTSPKFAHSALPELNPINT